MIIKIKKIHLLIFAFSACMLSFIFAMQSEKANTDACADISTEIPIVMYHHITTDKKRAGDYTVTAEELEKDLKYLKAKGYESVTVKDLIGYVNEGKILPSKPIMITFDDGFESFYKLSYPLLKKHNMKAVLSVIGYTTEKYSLIDDHNINYSNLTWNEVREMNESGIIEIQSHTYNLHSNEKNARKGMAKLKNETEEEYRNVITNDLLKLQNLLKRKGGVNAVALAYPFGVHGKETLKIVKDLGFKCTLTCEEKVCSVTQGVPESLYNLGRFNRPSGANREKFFSKLIK